MSDLNSVRTDVEILKKDVQNVQGLLSRLDLAIDKIADASNGISKILAVHENKIRETSDSLVERKRLAEKEVELLHKRISEKDAETKAFAEERHASLMEFLEDHDERSTAAMLSLDKRVVSLEKWKWAVVGGATVVGFLLAKMEVLTQFMS